MNQLPLLSLATNPASVVDSQWFALHRIQDSDHLIYEDHIRTTDNIRQSIALPQRFDGEHALRHIAHSK